MRRHDLVYLRPGAAFETPCAAAGELFWLAARDWIAQGRPLVAARQTFEDERVLLGLCLPLAQQRKKLSIQVHRSVIAEIRRPLSIDDCCPRLPVADADVLRRLAAKTEVCSIRVGVFGSLAWEALSAETYRHAESDIDLIVDVETMLEFEAMLSALRRAAGELSCRLDGEIRFPDGNAVAWRELATAYGDRNRSVLVKSECQVALKTLADLLAPLEQDALAA